MKETTETLVGKSQALTVEMRQLQDEVAKRGAERRKVWAELNNRGISQKRIAVACGVVEHTVYTELRKGRK